MEAIGVNHLWVSSLNPFAVTVHAIAARNTVNPRDWTQA
jgi:hypothetical protein